MTKAKEKRAAAPVSPPDAASDSDLFERAMADVVRLEPDPRGRVRPAPPLNTPAVSTPPVPRTSETHVDEPEDDFAAPGVDRREIRKLKRGDHNPDDRLDLHGMTTAEARTSVAQFIDKSRHRRLRCVCIVHGRGLHSEGKTAILKSRVREYLRSHRAVLAYADAPRADGGPGAVYVLLRK